MACSCGGGSQGDQFEAVKPDGSLATLSNGKTSGTRQEATAAVQANPGGFLRKAPAA